MRPTLDDFLLLLKEQKPLISSIVGLTIMLAAFWGVVQLMFLAGKSKVTAEAAQELIHPDQSSAPRPLRALLDESYEFAVTDETVASYLLLKRKTN